MREARHQRTNGVRAHLGEVPRGGRPLGAERTAGRGAGGQGMGSDGQTVWASFWGDKAFGRLWL